MPSADFCTAVRDPRGALSPYRTRCRSPGVSLTAFTAHLPNLQPGSAVDTGLRGPVPARPTQTASYSVPVRQVAALLPRFLQTAPRGHRPCASLALCLHQTWAEDLHLRAVKHARHTRAGAQPLENQGFSTAPQARPTLIRSDDDFLRVWILSKPGFPFCQPDQGLHTPTRLSARQISSAHVIPLPTPVRWGRARRETDWSPCFQGISQAPLHTCALSSPLRCTQAARQPPGTGSAQILRSMSPNSRRVRCPSASRSQ